MLRRPGPDSLWADSNWRRYWLSRVISYIGGTITYVAAPILVYSISHSALLTGVTTATEGLPYLMFGLYAGAIADRIDRRRMMVLSDFINAFVLATVPVAAMLGRLTVFHVSLVGFVSMSVWVFYDAANFGAVPTRVGKSRISAANSAVWGSTQLFDVVMPGLVGVVVAFIYPATLYWVNAFTFLASAFLVRSITASLNGARDVSGSVRDDVFTGVKWLWSHPSLRTLTLVGTATSFAMSAMMGQLVPFADQHLGIHQGDPRLGALFAVFSFGGLFGTLSHRYVKKYSPARISLVATSVEVVVLLLIPWPTNWLVTCVLTFIFGFANILAVVNVINFRQEETPEDLQSRINTSGRMLSWGGGGPIGALTGGIVAHYYSPAVGVFVGALVLAVSTILAWNSSLGSIPALRAEAHAGTVGAA